MSIPKTFLASLLAVALLPVFALEPGRRVPDIIVEKWISEDVPQELKTKDPVDVVMLFDAAAPGAFAFLKMLESVREASDGQIRDVKAIARNPAPVVEELITRNGALSIKVGADTAEYTSFKAYCDTESVLPMAFVVFKDGTLAWSGHPTGVASVVKRIEDGSFSVESQKRISILRGELQTALQSGLGAVVQRNAERILAVDPGDMVAVQAKLFVLESDGHLKEAVDFMAKACQKSPKDQELRLTFLNLLIRAGELDAFKAETIKCQCDFKDSYALQGRLCSFLLDSAPFGYLPLDVVLMAADSYSFQGRLCSFLLDNSPFGYLPLDIVLMAADSYASGVVNSPSKEKQAIACELRARTSYCVGRMADAADFQAKAVEFRKGGPFEVPAAKLLEFYKQAAALSKH